MSFKAIYLGVRGVPALGLSGRVWQALNLIAAMAASSPSAQRGTSSRVH
jgi:hypothetical protein